MKSKNGLKKLLALTTMLTAISGCSSLVESTRKSLLGSQEPRNTNSTQSKWVSRQQYDQLMNKYKNLLGEYDKIKENRLTAPGDDLIGDLQKTPPVGESVDVFRKDALAKAASAAGAKPVINKVTDGKTSTLKSSDVNKEIKVYKKAVALKSSGKSTEALKIFQVLEDSRTKQIRTRARYHLAQIYFEQNEYDLSLQASEKIIFGDAFSGVVLEALSLAVKNCDQLGLEEKKLKYRSMLDDVFGVAGKV
jgi:tetratricopeptide (TPR) repeat protein